MRAQQRHDAIQRSGVNPILVDSVTEDGGDALIQYRAYLDMDDWIVMFARVPMLPLLSGELPCPPCS